jgi:hypothetical protein
VYKKNGLCPHNSKTTGPITEIQTVLESAHRGDIFFFFFFWFGGGLEKGEGVKPVAKLVGCTSCNMMPEHEPILLIVKFPSLLALDFDIQGVPKVPHIFDFAKSLRARKKCWLVEGWEILYLPS